MAHAFLQSLGLWAALAAPALAGESSPLMPGLDELQARDTLQVDMRLFHLAPQPEPARALFSVAREAFEAQPQAGFVDVPAIREVADRHGIVLLGGPMLGALSHDGARVWVRTVKPAPVVVAVTLPGGERRFGPVASTAESDFTAVVSVTGLEPGTRYPYRVFVDDQPAPTPEGAVIVTAPAPEAKGGTRIAFGADFHKTGLWDRPLLDQIRTRGNSALLLLGDLATLERGHRTGLSRADYLLRDLSPAWRDLAAAVPVYAIWDDHDYYGNDASGIPRGGTEADRANVRTVWKQSWNNPACGFEERGRGIFFRTRIGPCDVIMLDTRFFRTVAGEADSFLGPEQMRWLADELAACTGPFIVLAGGTMWSDYVSDGKDSWGKWDPPGRERIFSLIEERRIGGVLLLSGDRHGARVLRIPRPSGFAFHEFELGSLGAHRGPPALGKQPELQPFGLVHQAAFGEFTFDTASSDPTVTLRVVDRNGDVRFQMSLARSQLMPGRPGREQP
jgi:alkaline phosphatase D